MWFRNDDSKRVVINEGETIWMQYNKFFKCFIFDGTFKLVPRIKKFILVKSSFNKGLPSKDIGIPISNYKDIPFGSRLIISYPFAATGNPHEDWNDIIQHCITWGIDVFVDACLAGVSLGKLDLTHSCITHVALVLAKHSTMHKMPFFDIVRDESG